MSETNEPIECSTANCDSPAKHRVVGNVPAKDQRRVLWFCDRHAPGETVVEEQTDG